jgi:hypothetical protein
MMKTAIPILALVLTGARAEPADLQQVSLRMAETMSRESAALRNYTVLRHYVLTTSTAGHSAEMLVRVTYAHPGEKNFEVLWERGSGAIQKRVFRRLLDAERDASRTDARITPANYIFHLLGNDTLNGRPCYVIQIEPRSQRKFLLRGRVWVDAQDSAVVRVEGEPADGNFWIKSTHLVQKYRKVGNFWLPATNESDTEVRIFGGAHLLIENLEYQINRYETDVSAEISSKRSRVE